MLWFRLGANVEFARESGFHFVHPWFPILLANWKARHSRLSANNGLFGDLGGDFRAILRRKPLRLEASPNKLGRPCKYLKALAFPVDPPSTGPGTIASHGNFNNATVKGIVTMYFSFKSYLRRSSG